MLFKLSKKQYSVSKVTQFMWFTDSTMSLLPNSVVPLILATYYNMLKFHTHAFNKVVISKTVQIFKKSAISSIEKSSDNIILDIER